jgi:pimeloyl-ACP methyl ester carboxylesterase
MSETDGGGSATEPNETQQTPPGVNRGRPVQDPGLGQPKPAEGQPSPAAGSNSFPLPDSPAGGAARPAQPSPQPPAGAQQYARQPLPSDARRAPDRPDGRPQPPAASPAHGRVSTIHYQLSYTVQNPERGARGAIVLLHDLPGGAFVWQGVIPALATTGRAVYAFDMLGYGESDHPWPSDTTVWGHADNLAPAFRTLGLTEIVLVGLGVGGGVAQVLATRMYREGIAALVLIDTYAYHYAYAPDWPMTQMEQRHDPDAPRHTTTEQMLADLRATLPNGAVNARFLAGSTLEAYLAEWNSDLGREMFFQHVRQMLPDYVLSVASDLKKLTLPTLIVWGEQDQVTPLTLGRRLVREIPGAQLALVPNAGHLVLDDASDRVAAVLTEFVQGLSAPAEAGAPRLRSAHASGE